MKKHTTIIRTIVLGAFVAALTITNVAAVGAHDGDGDEDSGYTAPEKGQLALDNVVVSPGDDISIWNSGDDSQCLPVDDEEVYIDITVKKGYTDLYAEAYTFPIPDDEGNWEITVRIPETSYLPWETVEGEWIVYAVCTARGPGDPEDIHVDTDYPLSTYPTAFFQVIDDDPGTDVEGTDTSNVAKPATSVKAAPSFTG